jgi:hypothetical protein
MSVLTAISRQRRNVSSTLRGRNSRTVPRHMRPWIESLERRALLSTFTQSQSFGPFVTPLVNQPLTPNIIQFNTQGGTRTLDSVEIQASSSIKSTLTGSISNPTLATQSFTYTASVDNATTSLSGPGLTGVSAGPATLITFDSGPQTLAPGATFTIPTQQQTLTAGPVDITLTAPGDLAAFIGGGILGPYTTSANANSVQNLVGSSNLDDNAHLVTTGRGDVTVIYTFHANPTITTATSGTVAVGSGVKMNDTADLENGINPTGNITFTLFNSSNTAVYTDVVPVSGNGTYSTTAGGNNNGGFLPTGSGTYQWVASYVSDNHANNGDVSSTKGDEPENAVNALIHITPLTPINEVNHAEIFTVTVNAFPAGTGTPTFGALGVTISPAPTSTTISPATINGNTATWTVTINSSAAGTFNVQASDVVTMGGVAVTRTTGDSFTSDDGSDGPSAVKNYVDANIAITPLAPVNEVGHAETFTVTVHASPAATGTPSFGPLHVTVSGGLTPTISGATINGNTATWTVTINSATAGTFTVTASDVVTMGGVAVTRTTGDSFAGDSPSAVKNFVDALIAITPLTATNMIGSPETFTVTVTAFPAATGTPSFATPVVTVSPVPTSETVSGLTINGNVATFTITINSNAPGVFTVTASDTVTMGGVAVTRTTGDGFTSGDGSDSNSAVKTYIAPPLTVVTTIFDAKTNLAVSGPVALGTSVFDTSKINGQVSGIPALGTLTYTFYPTLNGTGTPISTQTVPLNPDGTVPNSNPTGALGAGSYSYVATFTPAAGNPYGQQILTSAAEPLTVNQGNSATATAIQDASGGVVTGALGESVHDTATVTGSPFTPTGTVIYTFYPTINGTGTPISTQTVTLVGGLVPNSAATGALMAGSYSYIAVYSGDKNYKGSTSDVEPLTINQGNSATATVIVDVSGGPVTGLSGESVKDTATVTATSFTPGGTVTYTFYPTLTGTGTPISTQTVTLVGGLVPNSAPTGALMPGGYSYVAVYSGDSNYKGSTSAVEPLTIIATTPALTWGFWKNHTGHDSPVDAWPVGDFAITSDSTSTVSFHGTKIPGGAKNLGQVGPDTTMTVGGHTYSFANLQTIFASSVQGNGVINLGHQLIAAILNVANGAGTPTAISEIQQASDLLKTNSLVMGVSVVTQGSNPTLYAQLVELSSELDAFNSSGV